MNALQCAAIVRVRVIFVDFKSKLSDIYNARNMNALQCAAILKNVLKGNFGVRLPNLIRPVDYILQLRYSTTAMPAHRPFRYSSTDLFVFAASY